jgi:uncharacterized protein YbjT (DUF2867 family)
MTQGGTTRLEPRILVTGATGKTGSVVVAELLKAGVPVRAMVHREDGRSARLQVQGAEIAVAFYQANDAGLVAGQLGATYFIPTLVVPLLLITHGLVFRILLQHQSESAMREDWQPAARPRAASQ